MAARVITARRKSRTAFVLAGGASLGAMQVGMLRALYEHGIVPDLLVGTSAGALNAAFVASRPQSPTTADELADAWCAMRREQILPLAMRTFLWGVASRHDHLVPDRGLRRLVERHVQFERIEEADVELHVLAFDVLAGREVLLSRGPVDEALLAAAAIPGVFSPVRWGQRQLVDGGVANNTPISHAVELGGERVYVLPTRFGPRALEWPHRGALGAALHAMTLLLDGRLQADIALYGTEVELIVLPAVNSRGVQPTDFSQAATLIEEALAATREALGGQGQRGVRRAA